VPQAVQMNAGMRAGYFNSPLERTYRKKMTNTPIAPPRPAIMPRRNDATGEKGSRLTICSFGFADGDPLLNCCCTFIPRQGIEGTKKV
jgi:hypothetical protein